VPPGECVRVYLAINVSCDQWQQWKSCCLSDTKCKYFGYVDDGGAFVLWLHREKLNVGLEI